MDDSAPTAAERADAEQTLRGRQRWLTVLILLLALYTARAFLAPIAWAAVLAIALWPLYIRAIARAGGRENLIAFGFALATALLVMIPITIVAASAVQESQGAAQWVQHVQQTGLAPPDWLGGLPLVGDRLLDFWQTHVGSPRAAERVARRDQRRRAARLYAHRRRRGGERDRAVPDHAGRAGRAAGERPHAHRRAAPRQPPRAGALRRRVHRASGGRGCAARSSARFWSRSAREA